MQNQRSTLVCMTFAAVLVNASGVTAQDQPVTSKGVILSKIRSINRENEGDATPKAVAAYLASQSLEFELSRASFPTDNQAEPPAVVLVKPRGELVLIPRLKAWTADPKNAQLGKLPTISIESDIAFIEQMLPDIQETLANAEPAVARDAAYSAWANLRFDSSETNAAQLAKLESDKFLALMSDYAFIKVNTSPSGAILVINKAEVWGPTEQKGYVPSGAVRFTLDKDGYEQIDVTEQVHSKVSNPFSYTLVPK